MESLSPATKAVYEFLKADLAESLDVRFKRQDEEASKSMRSIVGNLATRIDDLKMSIGVNMDEIRAGMERPPTAISSSTGSRQQANPLQMGSSEGGAEGSRSAPPAKGKDHVPYVPPPARGTRSELNPVQSARYSEFHRETEQFGFGPRIDLPRFDGTNPRLWQTRCEDYFSMCGTPRQLWIQFASTMFEGPAARWLESVQRRVPGASWEEFCRLLQCRFGRNPHQALVRKFHSISQAGTMEEYVEQFAELYDQLSAYEAVPESILHQPQDHDAAYDLALLHESLTSSSPQVSQTVRRQPTSTTTNQNRAVTAKSSETHKQTAGEDKWATLRAYRKAKGLCFMCGEKWGKDHQCKQAISLHVVQEMVEFFQCTGSNGSDTDDEEVNLMAL